MKALYPNAKVFSILPTWTVWDKDPNWNAKKRQILRTVYEMNGVYIIDGHKLFPHNEEKYLSDSVHPNSAGFAYYGGRVAKIIKPFL